MKKAAKIFIPIAILIIGFIAMKLLTGMREEPTRRPPQEQTKIVTVEKVNLTDIQADISAFGRVVSGQPIEIVSEVSGTLLPGNIKFQPAATFKRGDLLIKVDDRQARLNLNSIKSDLVNALATVLPEIKVDFPKEFDLWQNYFDNCRFNGKLPELPETNNQKIKLFLARFNVYKLYFAARNQEIIIQKHYYYAPFNGAVVSADLRAGSTVRSGTRLGRIISLEELEVEVPLSAKDIHLIDINRSVSLISQEMDTEWTGQITRIGKAISERTETVPIYISIEENEGNNPIEGVFLKVIIPGKTITNAIEISSSVLYQNQFVYVVTDGKLENRPVVIARENPDTVIVDSGLNQDDFLVVDILQGVTPGMKVKPQFEKGVE